MWAYCGIPGDMEARIVKEGEDTTACMPDVAFRSTTWSRPPGWRVCQPGGIPIANHNLFKVRIPRGTHEFPPPCFLITTPVDI